MVKKLRFHSLVLETIDRCNARCAMCYQAAGPKGSDIRGDGRLPLDVVLRVIDEAAGLEELEGNRVHVSGGEGFLNYSEMLTIFGKARDCGFKDIGATTNAFWATDQATAEAKCAQLVAHGVNYLEVSTDFWHAPYVATARVRQLLRAARVAGIRVMLRTLTSRSHHLPELFAEFTDDEMMHIQIGNSTVAPVGRGKIGVPLEDAYGVGDELQGCCETVLNLTVTPNGNVYPCCAGSDMTRSLAAGNVTRESLGDAVLKMRTDYMIRQVIHGGTAALIPIVQQLGFGDRLLPGYSSICHLCWDIFRDDELSGALREHFENEQFDILSRLLTSGADAVAEDESAPV